MNKRKTEKRFGLSTKLELKLKDISDRLRGTVIRQTARIICCNRPYKCFKCGYDKHIEICHIKPVSQFSLESTIKEVNDTNNLILLCPNCHWEFDNPNKTRTKLCECGNWKGYRSNKCYHCYHKDSPEPYRPPKEELQSYLSNKTLREIGKIYKVSYMTVSRWADYYNLEKKSRGYAARTQKRNQRGFCK